MSLGVLIKNERKKILKTAKLTTILIVTFQTNTFNLDFFS